MQLNYCKATTCLRGVHAEAEHTSYGSEPENGTDDSTWPGFVAWWRNARKLCKSWQLGALLAAVEHLPWRLNSELCFPGHLEAGLELLPPGSTKEKEKGARYNQPGLLPLLWLHPGAVMQDGTGALIVRAGDWCGCRPRERGAAYVCRERGHNALGEPCAAAGEAGGAWPDWHHVTNHGLGKGGRWCAAYVCMGMRVSLCPPPAETLRWRDRVRCLWVSEGVGSVGYLCHAWQHSSPPRSPEKLCHWRTWRGCVLHAIPRFPPKRASSQMGDGCGACIPH